MRAIVLANRLKMQNDFMKQRMVERGLPNEKLLDAMKKRRRAIRYLKNLGTWDVVAQDVFKKYNIKGYSVGPPIDWVPKE